MLLLMFVAQDYVGVSMYLFVQLTFKLSFFFNDFPLSLSVMCLSVCLFKFIYLSVLIYLCIHLAIYLLIFVYASIYLSTYLYLSIYVCKFFHLYLSLSIYQYTYQSIYMFIYIVYRYVVVHSTFS